MAKYSRVKQSGDLPVLASTADLPLTGLRKGETVFANNSFYVSNGSGWYRITLINEAPSITLDADSISLGASGNTAYIGFTTVEPEGTPVTVSIANNTANSTQATVNLYTSNNTLVVQNLSGDAYGATITLTVSDGVNLGTDSLTVSVVYNADGWENVLMSLNASIVSGTPSEAVYIDRSSNGSNITTQGLPKQTSFHPYLDNWSVEFTSSQTSVDIADDTSLQFGTGDFTIEFWFNANNVSTTQGLVSKRDNTSDYWRILIAGGVVNFMSAISSTNTGAYGSGTVETNRWYHVAVVKESSTIRFYLDGVNIDERSHTQNLDYVGQSIHIGILQGGQNPFDGSISNVRLVKGTALYTSNFTPPTEKLTAVSGTSLLTCQSNRFIDNSSQNHTILTTYGNPEISAFSPFGQGSEYAVGQNKGSTYFNGSSGIVVDDAAASGSIYPADSDWTLSSWIYLTGTADNQVIFSWGASGIYAPINLYADASTGTFEVGLSQTGSTWLINSGNHGSYNLYEWVHVEFSRSGGTYQLFVNGESVLSGSISGSLMTPTQDISIGARPSVQWPVTGFISDSQYILGEALHTSNFTPPTAPVTSNNSAMYVPHDNPGIYDVTGISNPLTFYGNVTPSTGQTKFASASFYFDGSGDYIRADEVLDFLSPSTPFTVEAWMYQTVASSGAANLWFGCNTAAAGTNVLLLGTAQININGIGNVFSGMASNQWVHYAYIYDGSNHALYLNGVQHWTKTNTTLNTALKNCVLGIGAEFDAANGGNPGNYYTGFIENLQVSLGVKYTQAFTPPTGTQGITYQETS